MNTLNENCNFNLFQLKKLDAAETDFDFHQSLEEGEISSDSEEKKNECNYSFNSESATEVGIQWSELQILMIGDERVNEYNWKDQKMYPNQHFFHLKNANLSTLCEFVDRHINKTFDIVLIFAFHYDFVHQQVDNKQYTLNCKVRMEDLTKTVIEFHSKWEKLYTGTKIIWVIPSAVNFYQYNYINIKNFKSPTIFNDIEQHSMSKEYYDYTQKLSQYWKRNLKTIPFLNLNDVLFMKKHVYKKSFTEERIPKFPKGLLVNGLKPTKLMIGYLAYKLTEFMHEEGFFPLIKCTPNLKKTFENVLKADSSLKKYVHKRSKKRKSSNYNRHHKKQRRHYSDSCFSESSFSSDSQNKRHSRTRYQRKATKYEKNLSRRSTSSSRSQSRHGAADSAVTYGLKLLDPPPHSGSMNSASEEVEFYRKLACLREVHDIQCNVYRLKPTTHPFYSEEYKKFLNLMCASTISSSNSSAKWDSYWKNRLEEICNENWELKKGQMILDLQKKKYLKLSENKESLSGSQYILPNLKDKSEEQNANAMSNVIDDNKSNILHSKTSSSTSSSTIDLTDSPVKKEKLKIRIEDYKKLQRQKPDTTELQEEIKFFLASSENIVPRPVGKKIESPKCPISLENKNVELIKDSSVPIVLSNSNNPLPSPKSTCCTSSDSECFSIDSDCEIDVDRLMDDDDFLLDLKEIDDELQKAAPPPQISFPIKERSVPQVVVPPKVNLPSALAPLKVNPPNTVLLPKAIVPPNFGPSKLLPQATVMPSVSYALKEKILPKATISPLRNEMEPIQHESGLEFAKSINILEAPAKDKVHPSNSEICADYVIILKMLFRLSKHLGSLGLSVTALYDVAMEETKNNEDSLCSPDDDAKTILTLVNQKLNNLLKGNISQVQRAIFGEVSGRLKKLLDKLNMQYDKFGNVNIKSIALATIGQSVQQIVAFIKNTLLYHGYNDFESKDVMNLYMSVKAAHNTMGSSCK